MTSSETILAKIKDMTLRELAGEASLRARRRFIRALTRISDKPQTTYLSDSDLRHALNADLTDVASRMRAQTEHSLVPGLADLKSTVGAVKHLFPDSVEQSRIESEAILNHQVTLFGRVRDLGPTIDWHRDPVANVRWPLAHYTSVQLVIGQGADVRLVWELNRLHHLVALGRAYLLTNDERYTDEFYRQLASWHENNPPRFGVNWAVAMEAGIRAVNIIAAFQMFRGSPNLTDQSIALVLKILLAHGRFIRANLEYSYRIASNHYLSDLIGLFAIGTTVPEFRESRSWRDYSGTRMVEEMNRQVLSDGVDYELSIGYHRFVLEIFALFFSLCGTGNFDPGTPFRARLAAMFEFVRWYLKPDHTAPAIGDSDDGRLIRFKERAPLDHAYLTSIGAVLLQTGTLKQSSVIDDEAIWWFGQSGLATFENLPNSEECVGSQAFPDAQVFVQRTGDLYSIVDCGDHGARGRGSHAHSDALSLEVFAFNRTFLRDSGTYCYTSSEEERNLFRSTSYHNTVRIDGREISEVNRGQLFAFASNVRPHVNLWESTPERDVIDAEHYGYKRLALPVIHRRVVTFDKRGGDWLIRDIFTGEGSHRFEFFFNFDTGLEVTIDAKQRGSARDQVAELTIIPDCKYILEAKTEPRWVSPAYGTRLPSSAIIYSLSAKVPLEVSFQLVVSAD